MKKNSKLKGLLSLMLILTMIGITPAFALFSPYDTALLVQDAIPWYAFGTDVNRVVLDQLVTNGYLIGYDVCTMAELSTMDLSSYHMIIIANDQPQAAYDAYAGLGIQTILEAYAMNGGAVVFGACDYAHNWGILNSTLPGGLGLVQEYNSQNFIVDYTHPIITGILSGNNPPLTDADFVSNGASHETFFDISLLPEGANVIVKAAGNGLPTLVEYPLGDGLVIASGLTWEWSYKMPYDGAFAEMALDDLFLYALDMGEVFIRGDIDVKPGSDVNTINLKSKGNLPVAVLGSEYFDVTILDPSTVWFGGTPALEIGGGLEDVNFDGYMDIVFHFETSKLDIGIGHTEAYLTGLTIYGDFFISAGNISVIK